MESMSKIAVALKYDPSISNAPFVVAKGKGKIAEKIIEIAEKNGVPIVSSPDIISDLYRLEILEEIPEKLYLAVAEILAFLVEMEEES